MAELPQRNPDLEERFSNSGLILDGDGFGCDAPYCLIASRWTYPIHTCIGEGSFAFVLCATNRDGLCVAIKIPKLLNLNLVNQKGEVQQSDPFILFKKELDFLGRHNSPHLPRLVDKGTCKGFMRPSGDGIEQDEFSRFIDLEEDVKAIVTVPCAVLEFVDGISLFTLFPTRYPQASFNLPSNQNDFVRWCARVVCEAAEGLATLHESDCVHRDIAPRNIMVGGNPEQLRVMVVDLGLARPSSIDVNHVTLNPQRFELTDHPFLAPEVLDGHEHTPASDCYSLTCVLFWLLHKGVPPFEGVRTFATHAKKYKKVEVGVDIPDELRIVLERGLDPDPKWRIYDGGGKIRDDLKHFLESRPLAHARRPTLYERTGRWASQHPWKLLKILLPVLVAVTMTAAFIRELRHANENEAVAAQAELDHGISLCELDFVEDGLVAFAKGLQMAEHSGTYPVASALRRNITAWSSTIRHQKMAIPINHRVDFSAITSIASQSGIQDLVLVVTQANTRESRLTSYGANGRALWCKRVGQPVGALAISEDQMTVALGTEKQVRLIDALSGNLRKSVDFLSRIKAITVGSGDIMFVGTESGHLERWHLNEAAATPVVRRIVPGKISSMALSKDGQILALAGVARGLATSAELDNTGGPAVDAVSLFRAEDLQPLWSGSYGTEILDLKFGRDDKEADERVLAIGSKDLKARLLRLTFDSTRTKDEKSVEFRGYVNSVAFSHDGETVACGCGDLAVHFISARTGEQVERSVIHPAWVLRVNFGNGGDLITIGKDNVVRFLGPITPKGDVKPLPGTGSDMRLREVAWSPCGKFLAVCGAENDTGFLRIRECGSANPDREIFRGGDHLRACAYRPDDGRYLFTAGGHLSGKVPKGNVTLWDLKDGVATSKAIDFDNAVQAIGFVDQKRLVLGAGVEDFRGEIYVASENVILFGESSQPNFVCSIDGQPKSSLVVTGDWDGVARLWDLRRNNSPRKPLASYNGGAGNWVLGVRFDPSSPNRIAMGYVNGEVRFWNRVTNSLEGRTLSHRLSIESMAFDTSGKLLLTGSGDKTARLWDCNTRSPIGPGIMHGASVQSVAFNPKDPGEFVTASEDGTITFSKVPPEVRGTPGEVARRIDSITGYRRAGSMSLESQR